MARSNFVARSYYNSDLSEIELSDIELMRTFYQTAVNAMLEVFQKANPSTAHEFVSIFVNNYL
jgi:hypothetical protein